MCQDRWVGVLPGRVKTDGVVEQATAEMVKVELLTIRCYYP